MVTALGQTMAELATRGRDPFSLGPGIQTPWDGMKVPWVGCGLNRKSVWM